MMKGYKDAYQVFESGTVKAIGSTRKLDQLIRFFQKDYLRAWNYRSRLKRHLQPIALMNELLRDLNDYLQQIQQRKELRYNDEKMHMPVPSKIKFMMEEDNRIKSRLKGLVNYCRLRNDDFITTAVHMAEYWALNDLYSKISKDRVTHDASNENPTANNINNSKMNNTISVFISYSWDSEDHKRWVLHLANKLIENGIYVILDRYDLNPGKQMTHFMEKSVNGVNKVLLVMTPKFKEKADSRIGGVGFEYSMVMQELYLKNENDKFIPIRREGHFNDCAPKFLSSYLAHDMSNDATFEKDFELLLRLIYNEPEIARPPLGKKPAFDKQQHPITFNSSLNVTEALTQLSLEEQHRNLISSINEKRNIISLQRSSLAIEAVSQELTRFKKYFNERCEFLEQNKFDRYTHCPFNYAIHKALIACGQYVLECKFHLPGMIYDGITTTQDVFLVIELTRISGNPGVKQLVEEEHRMFCFTPVAQGWAVPYIQEKPTEKELEVLFNNRYSNEHYDLDDLMSTEQLIDFWIQKLLEFSAEGIKRYIGQLKK